MPARPFSTHAALSHAAASADAVGLNAAKAAASHCATAATLPQWSPKPRPGDTVYIAMSGGVDSSVVALLLSREPDLTLHPIYMRNWSTLDESGDFEPGSGGAAGCEWQAEWASVQAVCAALRLPSPRLVDLSAQYWASVFEPSLGDWASGRTPNPDVLCNKEIKFGALLHRLIPPHERQAGTSSPKKWLATGHYARLVYPDADSGGDGDPHSSLPQLHRARDRQKDQSYFLSSVPASALAHALFPLAHIQSKAHVKQLARQWDLPAAEKKESMGLCFVGKRTPPRKDSTHTDAPTTTPNTKAIHSFTPTPQSAFGDWIADYLPADSPYTAPGPIVALHGEDAHSALHTQHPTIIGQHQGLHTLTIGQGARWAGQSQKWFVARKEVVRISASSGGGPSSSADADTQPRAFLVQGADHPMLSCTRIVLPLQSIQWIDAAAREDVLLRLRPHTTTTKTGANTERKRKTKLLAQVRYRSPEVPCEVHVEDASQMLVVAFPDAAQRPKSVAPGQVITLYAYPEAEPPGEGEGEGGAKGASQGEDESGGAPHRGGQICLGSAVLPPLVPLALSLHAGVRAPLPKKGKARARKGGKGEGKGEGKWKGEDGAQCGGSDADGDSVVDVDVQRLEGQGEGQGEGSEGAFIWTEWDERVHSGMGT